MSHILSEKNTLGTEPRSLQNIANNCEFKAEDFTKLTILIIYCKQENNSVRNTWEQKAKQ